MPVKVIQTTPNIGIGITLQRLTKKDDKPADCQSCILDEIKLFGVPKYLNQGGEPYTKPTIINYIELGSTFIYAIPVGSFASADLIWDWSWIGDDVSGDFNVNFGFEILRDKVSRDEFQNNGGYLITEVSFVYSAQYNGDKSATLTITASCPDGSSASTEIDFLVRGF